MGPAALCYSLAALCMDLDAELSMTLTASAANRNALVLV